MRGSFNSTMSEHRTQQQQHSRGDRAIVVHLFGILRSRTVSVVHEKADQLLLLATGKTPHQTPAIMAATAKTSVADKADVDAFWSKLADCKEEGDFDKADDIISAEGKNSTISSVRRARTLLCSTVKVPLLDSFSQSSSSSLKKIRLPVRYTRHVPVVAAEQGACDGQML